MTPATAKPMRWDYEYFRADKREKERILNKIRDILMREDKVPLAIVFGSFTTLESFRDIDIAVYSLDTSLDYLAKLGAKLELGLGIPVDIVPITELDPYFKHNILTKGRIILEKAPGTYEALLREAEDEITAIELEEPRKRWLHSATRHTAGHKQPSKAVAIERGQDQECVWITQYNRGAHRWSVVSIPTT